MSEFRETASIPMVEEKTCTTPPPATALPPLPAAAEECPAGSDLVYVVTRDRRLHGFDPATHRFRTIGALRCPSRAAPHSMAVDRAGHAWVELDDGIIVQASIADASCRASSIPRLRHGDGVGMGMAPSTGGAFLGESLFLVQDSGTRGLSRIDSDGASVVHVGTFPARMTPWRGELTSSADGRLFALFTGSPFVIVEIDKDTAKVVGERRLGSMRFSTPGIGAFAFASVGSEFFVFWADGGLDGFRNTKVTRVRADGSVEDVVADAGMVVVGAGVSTCAARGPNATSARAVPPPLPLPAAPPQKKHRPRRRK